jgi:hypothetical protein
MVSIVDIIAEACETWGKPKPQVRNGEQTFFSFVCTRAPAGASADDVRAVQIRLGDVELPTDLIEVWLHIRSARLFLDNTYGQWGLELLDPQEVILETEQLRATRARDVEQGDLVVGRFFGDQDRVIVRSDPRATDYGTVLIALPLDRRKDWYVVANSLTAFVERFLSTEGDRFWEEGVRKGL